MLRNNEEIRTKLRETHHLDNTSLSELMQLEKIVGTYSKRLSIVSSRGVNNLWINLAEESCYGLPYLPTHGTVLDVGSGNGIPGLVWALLRPDLQFLLVEHVNKKARALEEIRLECGLKNVTVYPGNAQDINKQLFEIITARAVAPFTEIWEWTKSCRKVGTKYLLFRGSRDLEATKEYPAEVRETACILAGRIKLWVGEVI